MRVNCKITWNVLGVLVEREVIDAV